MYPLTQNPSDVSHCPKSVPLSPEDAIRVLLSLHKLSVRGMAMDIDINESTLSKKLARCPIYATDTAKGKVGYAPRLACLDDYELGLIVSYLRDHSGGALIGLTVSDLKNVHLTLGA